MSRENEYAIRLFLHWLNQRYGREFRPVQLSETVWQAEDSQANSLTLTAAALYETDTAWDERRQALELRLNNSRPGSYVLWVPPGGELPSEEPDESEWVRRVVLAASRLASGRAGEFRTPVKMMLGKVRDEGGYANVTGGLARHWTTITAQLNGSYYLDSRPLKRFTRDEDERQELFNNIGMVGQALASGDAIEFEHEDAWSLQRLPRSAATEGMEEGWCIAGCPPEFQPDDGALIRRLLRRRLADASQVLATAERSARSLVLIGAYDYMENENAGPALRGFDPSLTLPFEIIGLVGDAEVKPILMGRGLNLGPANSA